MFKLLAIFALISKGSPLVIRTNYGLVEGAEVLSSNGKLIHTFKKVPYAAPPVGNLRFSLPQPISPWTDVLNAKEYGPACMSNASKTTSPQKWVDEDCLHVNIFVSDFCLKSKNCPIVPYLHGGGFAMDSAVMFDDFYLVNNFAAKDVVLVIPGFRLGFTAVLFFGNKEVIPYNIGFRDIVFSLRWIRNNIHDFGGNANDVTIFGHSNGAANVLLLTFGTNIHNSRKLFHKGVAMSPGLEFVDNLKSLNVTWEFAYRTKCSPVRNPMSPSTNYIREVVECLRKIDGLKLLRIQREMEEEGLTLEGVVLDEELFPSKNFDELFANPAPVSLLSGATTKEMDYGPPIKKMVVNALLPEKAVHLLDSMGYKHPIALEEKYALDWADENRSMFTPTLIVNKTESPTLEGVVLDEELFPSKNFDELFANPAPVSLLSGATTKEMDYGPPIKKMVVNALLPEKAVHLLDSMGYKHPIALEEKYALDWADENRNVAALNHSTETAMLYLTMRTALHAMRRTGAKVYMYEYTNPRHPLHTDDLFHILGVHKFEPDESEKILTAIYPQYFINFIKTGRPDKDWEPLDDDDTYFRINVNLKTGEHPHLAKHMEKELFEYWTVSLSIYDKELTERDIRQKLRSKVGPNLRELNVTNIEIAEVVMCTSSTPLLFYLALSIGSLLLGYCIGRILTTKKLFLFAPVSERTPINSRPPSYDKLF